MHEYYPLLLAGGIIGLISVVLIIAYATVKDKKQTMGFERHMNDGEITRRLMAYAKPYALRFVFVGHRYAVHDCIRHCISAHHRRH